MGVCVCGYVGVVGLACGGEYRDWMELREGWWTTLIWLQEQVPEVSSQP